MNLKPFFLGLLFGIGGIWVIIGAIIPFLTLSEMFMSFVSGNIAFWTKKHQLGSMLGLILTFLIVSLPGVVMLIGTVVISNQLEQKAIEEQEQSKGNFKLSKVISKFLLALFCILLAITTVLWLIGKPS